MESTDDGFHSNPDVSEDDNIRKALLRREEELLAICENLRLHPSTWGKEFNEKLDKYARKLVEKEITDVSLAGILECYARQVLKQDDLKMVDCTLNHLQATSLDLSATCKDMNTLHKKAIKTLQNENEKTKKQLERVQPYFTRPGNDVPDEEVKVEVKEEVEELEGGSQVRPERLELMRTALSAMKKLRKRKEAQQKRDILDELEKKTKELEALNRQLAEIGF